jgi:integrase
MAGETEGRDLKPHGGAIASTAEAGLAPARVTAEGQAALARALAFVGNADSANTRRAYRADWVHFAAWCHRAGFRALPAPPATVAAYLAAHAGEHAAATLSRRLAAIARVHRSAGHPFDGRDALVRGTLRGLRREHATPPRRAAALTTAEIKSILGACGRGLTGLRDRALILVGYAGALRRSELVGLDVEHLRQTADALVLLLPRSKGDQAGEGQRVSIGRGRHPETCPVRAVEEWLRAAGIRFGPVFRKVSVRGVVEPNRLHPESVRALLRARAAAAGIVGTRLEPVSAHGLRAGFVTAAYAAGLRDEEIMEHTRHRSVATMRRYVRRARLAKGATTAKLGL